MKQWLCQFRSKLEAAPEKIMDRFLSSVSNMNPIVFLLSGIVFVNILLVIVIITVLLVSGSIRSVEIVDSKLIINNIKINDSSANSDHLLPVEK